MKIAVIGSGIAGNVTARLLQIEHDVTVFESNGYIGGHTNTLRIERDARSYDVDTGFIVFNPQTYPNFCRILEILGVASRETSMSFSVSDDRSGSEWSTHSARGLFARRGNLVSPRHWKMLAEIVRFNRRAPELLGSNDDTLLLGDYLAREGYSQHFVEQFIIPLGAAVWSTPPRMMQSFPARAFVRFCYNHGMLRVVDQPVWRTIVGGSQRYVDKLVAPFADRVRLRTPVRAIRRYDDHVQIESIDGFERFDQVVLATHSDQALHLLQDADRYEREILGAIPYRRNETVLHTDLRMMPESLDAWASWNVHVGAENEDGVAVTYDMNRLQGIEAPHRFLVTLNRSRAIDPSTVLARFVYDHPQYTPQALAAQRRWAEINGRRRTWFCGAYWRYGFHEDGVVSALEVCAQFGLTLDDLAREQTAEDQLGADPRISARLANGALG